MAEIAVSVVYSGSARQLQEIHLTLAAGSTVADALAHCPELAKHREHCGIYSRKATLHTVLQDQDRLELYRPLRVDPKTARRERFAKQGARSAGLFAQRRPGAKPGY
jgi:putative ubiquitin-RnfH superfamily antitoxin RatB of RatAB toxin-antitoxin module